MKVAVFVDDNSQSPVSTGQTISKLIGCLCISLIVMNIKRLFGTILTILGIIGLIYAAVLFVNKSGQTKALITYGILGIVFFSSGIGLIKTTKDEA